MQARADGAGDAAGLFGSMRRRIAAAAAVMAAVLLLAGCENPLPQPVVPSPKPTAAPTATPTPSPTKTLAPDEYSLRGDAFTEGDVTVGFPQVAEAVYPRQTAVNKLLEDAALAEYNASRDTESLTMESTWEAGRQDEVLSILYTGYSNLPDAAHPSSYAYAATLDMAAAKVCTLSDFVDARADVEDKIAAGAYELRYGVVDALDIVDLDALVKALFDGEWEAYTGNFYIAADGAVCLILGVPHAVGDYLIVAVL